MIILYFYRLPFNKGKVTVMADLMLNFGSFNYTISENYGKFLSILLLYFYLSLTNVVLVLKKEMPYLLQISLFYHCHTMTVKQICMF